MSIPAYFEPLRRSFRNWLRKRNRVLPTELPPPFLYARDINAVHEYFARCNDVLNALSASPHALEARCYLCNEDVVFSVAVPVDGSPVNWRESLVCPKCNLINRWRSCLHAFEAICEPVPDDSFLLQNSSC